MKLNRGIRALFEGYDRDFLDIPDSEENISTCVVLETEEEKDCDIKLANSWPDFICLNASMVPVAISNRAIVERIEDGYSLGKISLYDTPKIDSHSNIQNPKLCCAKVLINFENTGKYSIENDINSFVGKSFDDYEINFSSKFLFEKAFLITENSVLEKYKTDQNHLLQLEYLGTFVKCRIYPYGGFFEYGVHPKQIESCIFRTFQDGRSMYLRISSFNMLQISGTDPTCDQKTDSGYQFVGIKNFSESQKTNLYDELKTGSCNIEVINKNTNEKCIYKSNSVLHIAKTNLITINFIKEEK